jgi:hypothetical protein
MIAVPIGLAAFLLVFVGDHMFRGLINYANILGIEHFVLRSDRVDIWRITGAAIAGAAILLVLRVGLRRWGAAAGLVVVATLFISSMLHTQQSVIIPIHETRRQTSLLPDAIHRIERLAGVDVRTIDIAYEPGKNGGEFFGYQFLMPDVAFRPFDGETVPGGPWVLATSEWEAGAAAGARLVYPEGLVDSALWVLPSEEQLKLEKVGIGTASEEVLDEDDLAATVTSSRETLRFERGIVVPRLTVTVAHRGDRPWPSALDRPTPGAPVRVRAEWFAPDSDVVVWENLADLPYRVLPNEAVDVSIEIRTIGSDGSSPKRGRYVVRFAIVQGNGEPVRANGPSVIFDVR